MAALPSGTVTFLFTDIEGSTARWEHQPEAMRTALARHDALLRAAIREHGGHVVKTMGDAFHAVFVRAPDAVAAAVAAQRRLQAEPWSEIGPLRVRMAVHTGAAEERDGDYYGPPLNRAARLMSAGHGGQALLSQATYELVRDTPPDGVTFIDLGEHRLKDLIRPERVFQLGGTGLPSDFPPLNSLNVRPHNLPLQTTPLLGRDREVRAVHSLLVRDDVRLVTLTGPGGTGKTRLSLQVAADLLDRFEDGAFFVELAPISDPELVLSTIAQVLGVEDAGGRPLRDALVDYLRGRHLLLVLDNFEQVLAAATVVDALLQAGPGLRVLVTSRAPLQIRGEQEYPVPPLALPASGRSFTPEALSQYAAVALFIERAAAIKPDFAVTNANAPAVAELCTRLDGLPLAIELAAARIRLLSPEAMLPRLGQGLALLGGGRRDLPARQQTLRGAIAWSYDLLPEAEQRLFRRLSVFVGGFTLEAAEAACHSGPLGSTGGALGIDPLDGVGSLVENSLLVRSEEAPGGEPRFKMLETIREYGRESLELAGELPALQRWHAEYFLTLAEAAEVHLRGAEQALWLDILEAERDNMRAALEWSLTTGGDAELGLRLTGALAWFWYNRSRLDEASRRFTAALQCGPIASQGRVKVLAGAGRLAHMQQDSATARPLLAECLTLARQLGDRWWTAWTLYLLGRVAYFDGNAETARSFGDESLAVARELEDDWLVAWALHLLALAAYIADDYQASRRYFEKSLGIRRRLDFREGIGLIESLIAMIDYREGDYSAARSRLIKSLEVQRGLNSGWIVGNVVASLATLAAAVGQPERTARLSGTLLELSEAVGLHPIPIVAVVFEPALKEVRRALGDMAFAAAQQIGRRMSLDEVIAEALAIEVPDSPPKTAPLRAPAPHLTQNTEHGGVS